MAVTPHGWHIPGTNKPENYDTKKLVTQCGGVYLCSPCHEAYTTYMLTNVPKISTESWASNIYRRKQGLRAGPVIIDEVAHWPKPSRTPSSHYVIMGDGTVHDALTGAILTKHSDSTSSVDHPQHYNQYRFEVIDLVEDMSYNAGNAVKYLARAPFKGKELEDLKKAQWYIKKEIKRIKRQQKKENKA